jgi:NAD-dependent DNA ligase
LTYLIDCCNRISIQLKYLSKIGFSIVNYEILKTFDIYNFIEILLKFKKNSIFEIDGLIIQSNKKYTRNIDGNPKYAFAFKMLMDDNIIETKVVDVIWNISKLGKIKPRIKIEPVHLQGVKITYATGFNARYISNNKIGVDSIVKITRSGDVIPYIVEIVKQSSEGKMPTIPYKWNNTNVDIITDDFNDIKLITSFFEKLEIKYIGEKNVEKMYDYGLNDICKIISVSQETLYKIDGIGKKGAERIYTNIQNGIKHLKIQDVIAYSSIFGGNIGIKKVNKLFDSIPNILEIYKEIDSTNLSDMINKIDGFSDKTTNIIIENIEKTDNFIKQLKQFVVFDNNELVCVHNEKIESYDEKKYKNINVVITGKRDHIKNNVEISQLTSICIDIITRRSEIS